MWRKIVMPWATRLSASPPPAEWPSSEVRRHITNLLVNNMCWSVEPATKRAEQWKRGSGRRLLNASAARLQRLFGAGVGDCLFEMVRTCGLQPQPTTSACDSGDRRWSADADLTRRVFSFLWAAVTNLWVVYECLSAVSQGAQGPARDAIFDAVSLSIVSHFLCLLFFGPGCYRICLLSLLFLVPIWLFFFRVRLLLTMKRGALTLGLPVWNLLTVHAWGMTKDIVRRIALMVPQDFWKICKLVGSYCAICWELWNYLKGWVTRGKKTKAAKKRNRRKRRGSLTPTELGGGEDGV